MASEKVIVRASNPGQFETDNEPPWTKDPGNDTVYHIGNTIFGPSMLMECNPTWIGFVPGRVGINTDQAGESLTVHGNIQVSGQILQPSDSRLKRVVCEVDYSQQLENVNKIRIVKYKYRPEFVQQLPEEAKDRTFAKSLSK